VDRFKFFFISVVNLLGDISSEKICIDLDKVLNKEQTAVNIEVNCKDAVLTNFGYDSGDYPIAHSCAG
jgi:hypothetical protein